MTLTTDKTLYLRAEALINVKYSIYRLRPIGVTFGWLSVE